jgi:hypothetical protein
VAAAPVAEHEIQSSLAEGDERGTSTESCSDPRCHANLDPSNIIFHVNGNDILATTGAFVN